MRPLLFVLALTGCAETLTHRSAEVPDATVTGALPAGFDTAELADLQPGEIVVVGQPGSPEMAVVQATDRGSYVAVGDARCIDCIDPDCDLEGSPNFDRTIEVDVALVGGSGLETMETVTLSSLNFTNPSTYTFTPAVDPHNETLSVTGTLAACSTFSYRFDLQEVAPPPGFPIPFLEDFEDADLTYTLSEGEYGVSPLDTQDYLKRTTGDPSEINVGASYSAFLGSMFFAAEDTNDGGRALDQVLSIEGIDISGAVRPLFVFQAGANPEGGFESGDGIRVEASVDGAARVTLLEFTGNTGGTLLTETTRGVTLDNVMKQVSAAIPPGNSVDLFITMAANAGSEELAIDEIQVVDQPERLAFVSSTTYQADAVGGAAGADQKCQDLANAVGFGGEYRAWLSTSAANEPASTFTQNGSFVGLGGTPLAADWAQLTSGAGVPLVEDELGVPHPFEPAWTNTAADGTVLFPTSGVPSESCDGFTGLAAQAVVGDIGGPGSIWTFITSQVCETPARLYCFEQ